MLGIKGQLGAKFTERLCSNHTDWLVWFDKFTGSHIDTVSLTRYTVDALGGEDRLNLDGLDIFVFSDLFSDFTSDKFVSFDITWNGFGSITTSNTLSKFNTSVFSFGLEDFETWVIIWFIDGKDILGHIDKTTSEVTRVSSTKSGRDHTLTSTTGSDEGFKSVKTLLVARFDWKLNFTVEDIHHDTDFSGSNLNTRDRTTSTRVGHHSNVGIHSCKLSLEEVRNLSIDFTPVGNSQRVTFVIGEETLVVLILDKSSLGVTLSDEVLNFWVGWVVILTGRDRSDSFVLEGESLEFVSNTNRFIGTVKIEDVSHYLLQVLRSLNAIIKWVIFWQDFVEENATESSISNSFLSEDTNRSLKGDITSFVSHFSFINRAISAWSFRFGTWLIVSEVVSTKYDILVDRKHWRTIGWLQEIAGSRHQSLSFLLSFIRERKVNGHLVTIVVSVKAGSYEWVKLEGHTVNELWLESLDRETVKRWSTVQENIATLNNFVESVPNYRFLSVNHTRSGARVGSIFVSKQPRNHERFEELESHEFW